MLGQIRIVVAAMLLVVSIAVAGVGDGAWLSKVPEKDRAKPNPMASDPTAVAAGAKLFKQNCQKCHGTEGTGTEKKPPLNTERVQQATPGELFWLLKNGSLKNGMPSWTRLPEDQRWQIVTYLNTLK
jgi:mono/diheme cytochrome c family protein